MKKMSRVIVAAIMLTLLGGCADEMPSDTRGGDCAVPEGKDGKSLRSTLEIAGEWETDSGQKIRLADLRGKPRVFAMFFTTCEGTCVLTVDYLREMEASLPYSERSEVGFVLVTFDPGHDTTEALAAYRRSRNLSADRWLLLRGSPETTAELAGHLKLTFNPASSRGFVHSSGITVVDSAGKTVYQQLGLHPDLNSALAAVRTAVEADAAMVKGR